MQDLDAITTRLRSEVRNNRMKSVFHIIENHDRTFTVMYGRAITSTHRSREAAQREILKRKKRLARKGCDP